MIRKMKGHIVVTSDVGSGTIFRIFLPRYVPNIAGRNVP